MLDQLKNLLSELKVLKNKYGIITTIMAVLFAHYYLYPEKTKQIVSDVLTITKSDEEHITQVLYEMSNVQDILQKIRDKYNFKRVYLVALTNGVANKDLKGVIKVSFKAEASRDSVEKYIDDIQLQQINPSKYAMLFYIIDETNLIFENGKFNAFNIPSDNTLVISLMGYDKQHFMLVVEDEKEIHKNLTNQLEPFIVKIKNSLKRLE